MKYYLINDRKVLKKASLTLLDKAILEKCKIGAMNITRLIKAGKPYSLGSSKGFATTQEVLESVEKLQRLGLLERR
jgi:hypothetical protein